MDDQEIVRQRIDNLLTVADRFDHPGGSRRLAQRARDKASGMETALRLLQDLVPPSTTHIDYAVRTVGDLYENGEHIGSPMSNKAAAQGSADRLAQIHGASDHISLVMRTRTTYADRVTDWSAAQDSTTPTTEGDTP